MVVGATFGPCDVTLDPRDVASRPRDATTGPCVATPDPRDATPNPPNATPVPPTAGSAAVGAEHSLDADAGEGLSRPSPGTPIWQARRATQAFGIRDSACVLAQACVAQPRTDHACDECRITNAECREVAGGSHRPCKATVGGTGWGCGGFHQCPVPNAYVPLHTIFALSQRDNGGRLGNPLHCCAGRWSRRCSAFGSWRRRAELVR